MSQKSPSEEPGNGGLPPDNEGLAALLGVSVQTVRSWKRSFPAQAFLSPRALLSALATKQRPPTATVQILRAMLEPQPASNDLTEPLADADDADADDRGVGRTIARLEEAEVAAWFRYQSANDPMELKLSGELWLRISNSLLNYERNISADKRAAGELIEFRNLEEAVQLLARSFYHALHVAAVSHVEHHGNGIEAIQSFLQNAACLSIAALGDFTAGDATLEPVDGRLCQLFSREYGSQEFSSMSEMNEKRLKYFSALLRFTLAQSDEERAGISAEIQEIANAENQEITNE